jgi:hypothetical protein
VAEAAPTSPAAPVPPAAGPVPAAVLAQMREILTAIRATDAEAYRTHALHWLVLQRYQHHPLVWQFTWQEAWHVHARVALVGLLHMAAEQQRATPDLMLGVATALANYFGSHEAAMATWQRFLATTPMARNDQTVAAFQTQMQAIQAHHQALNRVAMQVHRTILQSLPVPQMFVPTPGAAAQPVPAVQPPPAQAPGA